MSANINNSILLINKPVGKTSFEAVSIVRKSLKIKKAGHCGTLDKKANGLLVLGINKSTKLLKYLFGLKKEYRAEINFGIQTTTDDTAGTPLHTYDGHIDKEVIEREFQYFKGQISQLPPDFSAKQINGKRAYKMALNNQKPELKPKDITIYNSQILAYNEPVLTAYFECSTGTYIRSIARDLGIKTGYYAHLYTLKRTSIGPFQLTDANSLEDIQSGSIQYMTIKDAFANYSQIEINEDFISSFQCGKKIDKKWFPGSTEFQDGIYFVFYQENFLGVIKYKDSNFSYDLVY